MGKLWVVTCDDLTTVLPNRAAARLAARIANEYGICTNPHTVLELDAWNLLVEADLENLRQEINDTRRWGFTYANTYQAVDGTVRVVALKSREDARYVHRVATQPRDYVVPVAAVEAAWNQRTGR